MLDKFGTPIHADYLPHVAKECLSCGAVVVDYDKTTISEHWYYSCGNRAVHMFKRGRYSDRLYFSVRAKCIKDAAEKKYGIKIRLK